MRREAENLNSKMSSIDDGGGDGGKKGPPAKGESEKTDPAWDKPDMDPPYVSLALRYLPEIMQRTREDFWKHFKASAESGQSRLLGSPYNKDLFSLDSSKKSRVSESPFIGPNDAFPPREKIGPIDPSIHDGKIVLRLGAKEPIEDPLNPESHIRFYVAHRQIILETAASALEKLEDPTENPVPGTVNIES
jgi:hypothetical protein